jgi:hypothetical protein
VNARYSYNAGTLTIHQGVQGGTVSLQGQAKRMTKGYAISGTASMVMGSGDKVITMSGTFSVTKAH